MRAVLVDASDEYDAIVRRLLRPDDPDIRVHRDPNVTSDQFPDVLGDAAIAMIDHTDLPTDIARQCKALRHVVFLGTGARSYMDVEELAELGINVHTIKGYGDIAVAECAMALMWAGARDLSQMDRQIRKSVWKPTEGVQLSGKTLGLIGFGGIASAMAGMARGIGMQVLAWNRTPKEQEGVRFVALETLLAESDVVSMHLLLTDDTRGFLSRKRLALMRRGAILINTARGALVDEDAMIDALVSGQLRHAGLDVYAHEPLPAGHPLTGLPNVTLSAHAAFLTPEASENLISAALDHCRRLAQ